MSAPAPSAGPLWAVIPVKPLHSSKSRLAHLLSPTARADLIHRFLQHTLALLTALPDVAGVLVVSRDPAVLALAAAHGAVACPEPAPHGLNTAVSHAVQSATRAGAARVLVLPADLPFVQPDDLTRLLAAAAAPPAVVICPDRHEQGTNALLLAPPAGFRFQYGPGSFRQHLAEAARLSAATAVVHIPGLQFDLDTEADWHVYLSQAATSQAPTARP
ncbi:MAG: 2-phospho-L-lactate guanylyltransferase [Anaerolineales bacterium]|nr:2-phospho-L-lactate guanylyltransferase [Anaerolineales bacterium]